MRRRSAGPRPSGSLDNLGWFVAAGLLVVGLISAALLVIPFGGADEEVGDAEPTLAVPRTPVCLRVGADSAGLTPLQAVVAANFSIREEEPFRGKKPFVGWPRRIDDGWRWGAAAQQRRHEIPADVTKQDSAVDVFGDPWGVLTYTVSPVSAAAQSARVALAGSQTIAGMLGTGVRAVVPAQYLDPAAPRSSLPHPAEPGSIAPGASLLLGADVYTAAGGGQRFEQLRKSLPSGAPGDEPLIAITPVDYDTVDLTVGTPAAVEQAARLGPRIGDLHETLTMAESLDSFVLLHLSFDISTAQGRTAYWESLDGRLPGTTEPGVLDRSVVSGGEAAVKRAVSLRSKAVKAPASYFDAGLIRTVRENADGSATFTRTQVSTNQVYLFTEDFDADGERRSVSGNLRLADVPPSQSSRYNRWFAGSDASVASTVSMVLDLQADDLDRLRSDTLTLLVDWFNSDTEGQRIKEEVLGARGLATRDGVTTWLHNASGTQRERVLALVGDGDSGGFVEQATVAVARAWAEHADDDWATYVAFTDVLAQNLPDAPTALAYWGQSVGRATGTDYHGFGSATCTSVD